jgi:hypothetical protein
MLLTSSTLANLSVSLWGYTEIGVYIPRKASLSNAKQLIVHTVSMNLSAGETETIFLATEKNGCRKYPLYKNIKFTTSSVFPLTRLYGFSFIRSPLKSETTQKKPLKSNK